MSNFVLVKYQMNGFEISAMYNVMPAPEWDRLRIEGRRATGLLGSWEEISRGTAQEMQAIAMLMPDPRIIGVDEEES